MLTVIKFKWMVETGKDKSNPYRSGPILGITESAFKRNFDDAPPMNKWCYIDTRVIDKMLEAYKDLK